MSIKEEKLTNKSRTLNRLNDLFFRDGRLLHGDYNQTEHFINSSQPVTPEHVVAKCPKRPAPIAFLMAIIFVQLMTGCTPTTFNIYANGHPAPKETELAWSADGEMYASWVLARWYPKKITSGEYSELIDCPEYLSAGKLNILANDTTSVVTDIHIFNPKGQRYRLVKVIEIGGTRYQEPASGWTIRPYYALRIENPLIANQEVRVSLTILSGESGWVDTPLISTGEVRYIIDEFEKGGGSNGLSKDANQVDVERSRSNL